MITVKISVGIGVWKAYKTVELVACPHVGDMIVVGDVTVDCQRVFIGPDHASVDQTIRFSSEKLLEDYVKMGWTRRP